MMRLLTLPPVTETDKVPPNEVPTEIARLLVLQAALAVRLTSPLAVSQTQATNPSTRLIKAKEINAFLADNTLLEQKYVKDTKQTVQQLLGGAKIVRFAQVKIGK